MLYLWPCRVSFHRFCSAFSVAPGDTPVNFCIIMLLLFFCWQKIVASHNVFITINLFIIDCLTSIPTSKALPGDLYNEQR